MNQKNYSYTKLDNFHQKIATSLPEYFSSLYINCQNTYLKSSNFKYDYLLGEI